MALCGARAAPGRAAGRVAGVRRRRLVPLRGVGARNSAVVVDLPRCGPMLSPRVPIPGPRMDRVTPGQRHDRIMGTHRVEAVLGEILPMAG